MLAHGEGARKRLAEISPRASITCAAKTRKERIPNRNQTFPEAPFPTRWASGRTNSRHARTTPRRQEHQTRCGRPHLPSARVPRASGNRADRLSAIVYNRVKWLSRWGRAQAESERRVGTGTFGSLDAEHIWLRQAVTRTEDGQTRTIEIAIPLRIGATASEVEALLAEADLGMERLAHHLDAHLAGRTPEPSEPPRISAPTEEPPETPEMPHPHVPAQRTAPATSAPMTANTLAASTVSHTSTANHASAPTPTNPATPSRTTPTLTATPPATAAPTTPPVRGRTSGPLPSTAVPGNKPAPVRPTPAAAASAQSEGELTRPDFIKAAATLGLNPKQAMEHLGVRTLEGLNLREALETLRRQTQRGGEGTAEPGPSVSPASGSLNSTTRPASGTPTPAAPAAPRSTASAPRSATPPRETTPAPVAETRFFEEEDDLLFSDEEGEPFAPDALRAEAPLGAEGFDTAEYATMLDVEDLPDLPDLPAGFDLGLDSADEYLPEEPTGMLPEEGYDEEDLTPPDLPRSSPAQPAPRGRIAERPATAPSASGTTGPISRMSPEERTRATARIGKLRAAQGGGAATPYQLNAYKNLVTSALGEPTATQLVRGLWNLAPAQLSSEQLAELVDWAKKDEAFEEEAQRVLAVLRAERERQARESGPAPRGASSGTGARGSSASGRSAPRTGGGS